MLVLLRPGSPPQEFDRLIEDLEEAGLRISLTEDSSRTLLSIEEVPERLEGLALEGYSCVERVLCLARPYRLAARETHPEGSCVKAGPACFGDGSLTVIAGPCAVEDEATLLDTARAAKRAGAQLLRGGAYKPRTSPYDFQGLGEPGLEMLRDVASETGLGIVTEALDPRDLDKVAAIADMIQLGSRNMQNYALLKAAAETGKPVMLKRGRACTVTEWLCAAEYLLAGGNSEVVLCERGLVSHDSAVRNLLDLSCVPLVRRLSHLPVVVDPSHATGRSELVPAMARAAVAAGADGVMIEVHSRPERARSDARQALRPEELETLVPELTAIHKILARSPHVAGRST